MLYAYLKQLEFRFKSTESNFRYYCLPFLLFANFLFYLSVILFIVGGTLLPNEFDHEGNTKYSVYRCREYFGMKIEDVVYINKEQQFSVIVKDECDLVCHNSIKIFRIIGSIGVLVSSIATWLIAWLIIFLSFLWTYKVPLELYIDYHCDCITEEYEIRKMENGSYDFQLSDFGMSKQKLLDKRNKELTGKINNFKSNEIEFLKKKLAKFNYMNDTQINLECFSNIITNFMYLAFEKEFQDSPARDEVELIYRRSYIHLHYEIDIDNTLRGVINDLRQENLQQVAIPIPEDNPNQAAELPNPNQAHEYFNLNLNQAPYRDVGIPEANITLINNEERVDHNNILTEAYIV